MTDNIREALDMLGDDDTIASWLDSIDATDLDADEIVELAVSAGLA